ncbi:MAG: hypothetical protein RBG13Loki_3904 [Promethearchaeota archaeon CR_4]|nr:MAG: hypothetical protein RBG13Loki_3904 [Candidatus Lokiarchaeota archaeon CR_4]
MAEFFKLENVKLKQRIQELEDRLVNVVGLFKAIMPADINSYVEGLISSPQKEMKIVAKEVDSSFADCIIKAAQAGKKIRLVTSERPKEKPKILPPNLQAYEKLKNIQGIDVIETPNLTQILIILPKKAFFSAGSLTRENFARNNQLGFEIGEKGLLEQVQEIFAGYLPSFMR